MSAIYGELYYDGFIPGAIVVGITWGGHDPELEAGWFKAGMWYEGDRGGKRDSTLALFC